jgi:hypothetical protein
MRDKRYQLKFSAFFTMYENNFNMKEIEKLNQSKLPIAIYDSKLDKLEKMPLFQKKVDLANAILAASPPTLLLRKRENKRIQ